MTGRKPDETDELVRQWAQAVPEIDQRVERVVDRLMISAKYLEQLAGRLSAQHDLQFADYEILARLYWTGPPHRLRPSQLAAGTLAPATSITGRLDRLESRGMIHRVADPRDRRVLAAELTDYGRPLFERIVATQALEERGIFELLDDEQLRGLDAGLRGLMEALQDRLGPAPRRVDLALNDEDRTS